MSDPRATLDELKAALAVAWNHGGKPTRMSWWDANGFHYVDIGPRFRMDSK